MTKTRNMKRPVVTTVWRRVIEPFTYLWKLRGEIHRYRWRLVGLGLLGTAMQIQAMVAPQITRKIIDVAYPARDFRLLIVLTAIIVGLNLFSAAVDGVSTYVSTYVTNLISFRVRMRVFHALHRVPVSYVESHQSGMFLERVATDADSTAGMLSGLLPQIIGLVMTAVITVILMLKISAIVTLLVMAIVPLYYTISTILALRLRVWQRQVRLKDEQLTTSTVEAIQGVPTARIFGVGNWLTRLYKNLLRDKIRMAFGMWRVRLIYGRMSWAATYFWGVLLTFGVWFLVFQDRLTLGDAVALGMYIPLLLRPAEQAISIYQSLVSSSVSVQRVTEILDAVQNGKFGRRTDHPGPLTNVRLSRVSFSYPGSSWTLRDIGLEISSGETAVVLGATGSGKTTLLRLMAGMFDGYQGDILADGRPLSTIKTASYQENVGMVMAENFFFSGTIMENMRIAAPHVDPDAVREAAKTLGLDEWLESLPQGYKTQLGVGGMRLSSGQLQKIAVLRAMLKKPRLLLLDEITSAMDVESERRVLDGIQILRTPQTMTVLTTHRLTLTREPFVSRVVILRDGAVMEDGKPRELYTRGGEYARLMNLAGLGDPEARG